VNHNSHSPLSPRGPRACVSLAFCPVTPQYLAVGLDKLRNDSGLYIWDLLSSTPTRVLSPLASSPTHIVAPPPSPARLPTGLPPSPRPHHPIPRTELGPRVDLRTLQTHSSNESVHSLAWLPQSNHILAAGLSQRVLRLFDLRSSAPAVANAPGRVYALSTDPFEPHHLAATGDGIVTLWDVRKMPVQLLTFSERDALADGTRTQNGGVRRISDLEFSSVRRGVLATLGQDASYVRFWNVIKTESFDAPPTLHASDMTRTPKMSMSWTNALPWSASGGTHNVPAHSAQSPPNASYSLVLSDTRKCKYSQCDHGSLIHRSFKTARRFHASLRSFALMPATRPNPLVVSLMAITKDDDLETTNTHDTPIHVQWCARGSMAVAVGSVYRIFHSVPPGEVVPDPWSVVPTIVSEGTEGAGIGAFPIEVSRGRSPRLSSSHRPTFGRGDEDGFPALTSAVPSPKPSPRVKASPLPAQKAKEGPASPARRSVPASPYLKGNAELSSSPGPASLAPPSPALGSRPISKQSENSTSLSRVRSASGRPWRRAVDRAVDRVQALVDEDISMVMRRRVIKGYGLGYVRFMCTTWIGRSASSCL
jgi:WD40 repeat protein